MAENYRKIQITIFDDGHFTVRAGHRDSDQEGGYYDGNTFHSEIGEWSKPATCGELAAISAARTVLDRTHDTHRPSSEPVLPLPRTTLDKLFLSRPPGTQPPSD